MIRRRVVGRMRFRSARSYGGSGGRRGGCVGMRVVHDGDGWTRSPSGEEEVENKYSCVFYSKTKSKT